MVARIIVCAMSATGVDRPLVHESATLRTETLGSRYARIRLLLVGSHQRTYSSDCWCNVSHQLSMVARIMLGTQCAIELTISCANERII